MPCKPEKKQQSRARILQSAATLFTRNGFDAISIDDVMRDAGLTRGAFYAHFSSKTELYREAILEGARVGRAKLFCKGPPANVLEFARHYLELDVDTPWQGCPLAFLVTDIAHQVPEVKKTYTQVLKGYRDMLVAMGLGELLAMQICNQLIGARALARAVDAPEFSRHILLQSLEGVRALLEANPADSQYSEGANL